MVVGRCLPWPINVQLKRYQNATFKSWQKFKQVKINSNSDLLYKSQLQHYQDKLQMIFKTSSQCVKDPFFVQNKKQTRLKMLFRSKTAIQTELAKQ